MVHLLRPITILIPKVIASVQTKQGFVGAPPDPSSPAVELSGEYRDVARDVTTPDDDLCFALTQHDV